MIVRELIDKVLDEVINTSLGVSLLGITDSNEILVLAAAEDDSHNFVFKLSFDENEMLFGELQSVSASFIDAFRNFRKLGEVLRLDDYLGVKDVTE